MEQKREQKKGTEDQIKRNKRKKKMSYRKKILYFQIGAITLAVFLMLLVGAAVLTKIFVGKPDNSRQTSTKLPQLENEADNIETDNIETESAENGGEDPGSVLPEEEGTGEESEGEDGISEENTGESQEETTTVQPVETVKLTVSMVGDCTIGTDEFFDVESNFDAFYIVKKDLGYFFQNVKDIFAQDDLTVINMEGTLTTSTARQDKQYAFRGKPQYTEVLTKGNVDAANMANNHSKDYGEESYTDTIQYLEDAGITTFGYDRTAVIDVNGVDVGLVGIYALSDGLERTQQLIDNIQAARNMGAQLVIVSFHWGSEKETQPNDVQKTLAHTAIDNGADLVVGHHPHVLQGIEEYNGKNIVYSLGNFCFGGNRNPADKDTMIFQQTFSFENGSLVSDNVTNIIPCSISSVKEYNDYQPTPLEGSEADRVMQKIQDLSASLSGEAQPEA